VAARARSPDIFSALTPICWKPLCGFTTSATRPASLRRACTLDGARYLRDAQHARAMLCRLVAYRSCAIIEAGERGLADVLSLEFEPAPHAISSVLTYCDTSGVRQFGRPDTPVNSQVVLALAHLS
jgi:hypothetical protein